MESTHVAAPIPSANARVASATTYGNRESSSSAISWAAIIGGAVVAAAFSIILLIAGSGLGFSAMSPWGDAGSTAKTIGIAAIVWLIFVQLVSSGIGGYMAGRLRTKWADTHSDEVYFRDTAHGVMVWAVGAVITAIMLSSAASSLVGGAAKVGGAAVTGVATAGASAAAAMGDKASSNMSSDYMVDTLFRSDRPDATGNPAQSRTEVGRILTTSLSRGDMTAEDKAYVARVISQQTGVDQPTAEKRVNDMVANAKATAEKAKQTALEAADAARKGAALFALWAFVSLLVGAFSAAFFATVGGRARDNVN